MKKNKNTTGNNALARELIDQVFLVTEMHKSTKSKFAKNSYAHFFKRWFSKFDGTALEGAIASAGIGLALKHYKDEVDNAFDDFTDYASRIVDDVAKSGQAAKEKVDAIVAAQAQEESSQNPPSTLTASTDLNIEPPSNLSVVKNFYQLDDISDTLATINSTSLRFSQSPSDGFDLNSNPFGLDDIELNAFSDAVNASRADNVDDINNFSSNIGYKGLSLGSTTNPYSYESQSELSLIAGKFNQVESEFLTEMHLNLGSRFNEPDQYIQMISEVEYQQLNEQDANSAMYDPLTATFISTLAVGAFAMSKLTSIVKLLQLERNLDEIVERGNETALSKYGDVVQAITYLKQLDTIDGLRAFVVTEENPDGLITKSEFKQLTKDGYDSDLAKDFLKKKHLKDLLISDTGAIQDQSMWINLVMNMQHKRIWVLPKKLSKDAAQDELAERVTCANVARTIFRHIGESYNDKTKKNVRELHVHTGDLSRVIAAKFLENPLQFKQQHPSLHNAIKNTYTSDSFVDKTLMSLKLKSDEKRFESRLANKLSEYILRLKVGNTSNQEVIMSINKIVNEFTPTKEVPAQVLPRDVVDKIKESLSGAAKDIGLKIIEPKVEQPKRGSVGHRIR